MQYNLDAVFFSFITKWIYNLLYILSVFHFILNFFCRAKSETSHSRHSSDHSAKSSKILVEDPFKIFESSSPQRNSTSALISDPLDQGARKSSVRSSIDELEDFATGRMPNDANEQSDVRKDRAEARFKHVKEVREKKNTAKQESVSREQKETGKAGVQTRVGKERQASGNENDLEKIFSMGAKPKKEQSPRSTTEVETCTNIISTFYVFDKMSGLR